MIPKIIHMCWLGSDTYPASIQRCIDSWRVYLPDYEVRLWNYDRFARGLSPWVDAAVDARKYAFAADYIRAYALYTEGGIYLDADVEAVGTFDGLLHLPYFMGYENGSGNIEAAVMGAEPGNPLFGRLLEYYRDRSFVLPDGSYDTRPLPYVLGDVAKSLGLSIHDIDTPADFDASPSVLSILPHDYFSPIHIEHKELQQTPRTIAIHHFAASWTTGWPRYRRLLKSLLGPRLTKALIATKRRLLKK